MSKVFKATAYLNDKSGMAQSPKTDKHGEEYYSILGSTGSANVSGSFYPNKGLILLTIKEKISMEDALIAKITELKSKGLL